MLTRLFLCFFFLWKKLHCVYCGIVWLRCALLCTSLTLHYSTRQHFTGPVTFTSFDDMAFSRRHTAAAISPYSSPKPSECLCMNKSCISVSDPSVMIMVINNHRPDRFSYMYAYILFFCHYQLMRLVNCISANALSRTERVYRVYSILCMLIFVLLREIHTRKHRKWNAV